MSVKSQPESDSKRFAALIQQMRDGSDDAAWHLLETYGSHIKAVVRRSLSQKLRVQFDSNDFVQSVWGSVIRAEHGFAEVSNAKMFVMAIARNKIVKELRKRHESIKYDISREVPVDGLEGFELEGHVARPSEWAQARERWSRIMKDQSETGRAVVQLRIAGHTFDEIAARLNISERTARRIIQRLLAQQEEEET